MAEQLRSIWAQIHDQNKSDVTDDAHFFNSGGDSVDVINFVGQANRDGVEMDAQSVFDNPIFSDLVVHCEERRNKNSETSSSSSKKIGTTSKNGQLMSSKDTMHAWMLIDSCLAQCQMDGSLLEDFLPCTPFQAELMTASHNFGCWMFQAVFELEAGDEARVRKTLEIVRDKNPVFRTRIVQHETELYQLVLKDDIHWQVESGKLDTYKAKDLSKRMCFGDPLCRYAIVHDGSRTFFVWTKTHAIYDRFSKMHVLDDVRDCFRDPIAFAQQPNRPTFGRFVENLQSIDSEESIEFWRAQLKDLKRYDTLGAPSLDKNFITSKTEWLRKTMKYKKPKNTHITFATIAHVTWALCLANVSGFEDVFYCAFRSCRQMALPGVESIIGPLWSMVPVRVKLQAEQSLKELLQRVQDGIISGIKHEPFGIKALEQHFGHKNYLQSVLLPQPPQPATFGSTMTAQDDVTGSVPKLRSADNLWTQTRGHYGLYIMLTPKGEDLEVWARYDESFIDNERVGPILDDFIALLDTTTTAEKWEDTSLAQLCPHLSEVKGSSSNESQQNGVQETNDLEDYDSKSLILTGLVQSQDETAVIIPGKDGFTISHKELRQHIKAFQQDLAALGIKAESAVSIALPNSYELIVSFLATTWQRAIAAPLNPAYKKDEFEFYIDDLGSAAVLVPKGAYEKGGPAIEAAKTYKAAVAECYWDGSKVVLNVKEKGKLEEEEGQEALTPQEDDVALVLHTSGTTGRPKAVPLTHKNLMANIDNICTTYKLTPKDRTMLIMPLFHVHGLLASFLSPLRSGGSAVIPARLTQSFWPDFADHDATWYTATPTMHRLILSFPQPDPLPSKLRFIRSCSSQLDPKVLKQLEDRFKAPVLESYAMTEASHLMTSNPLPPAAHKPGSVGKPQGDVKMRLCTFDDDGKNEKEVKQGEEGEVCVRGPNVTNGYLNNDEANKSSFTTAGFFRTGDQGKLDDDGYLFLTGRLKEMINKGGEKISPVELDGVVAQHDAVAEAVCFAIDDEMYGQEVGCAVKLHDGKEVGERELRTWIKERVAAHKVPKKIWFPSQIPKTATGKLQRKMVAEAMMKEMGKENGEKDS